MAAILLISIVRKNFKLLTPMFGSLENWRCKFSFFQIFHWFIFSPITHPRFHFNIYAWLHLKHLCVDIYASLVYPTSHLCVVLHFPIFVLGRKKESSPVGCVPSTQRQQPKDAARWGVPQVNRPLVMVTRCH